MRLTAALITFLVALPFLGKGTPLETPLVEFVEAVDDANLPIIALYQDATKTQQAALRGVQMEVAIDAKLPRLEKQGRMILLQTISKLGKITNKVFDFKGDDTIKSEVIARYLEAERDARETGEIAISPVNYKFRHKGSIEQNGQRVELFQITPKKKRIGLFKGDLWLDAKTGMPVRESGQLVKTPSIFLKKVEFTRDYELHDGIAIPKHISSKADVRLFGSAELNINYSNFTKQENAEEPASTASAHY